MTQTPLTTAPRNNTRLRVDHGVAVLTIGLAGFTYLGWRAVGVAPAVRSSQGTFLVGLVSVLVTAAVVSVAGLGLLRFIERRHTNAVRRWTLLAVIVWLGSLLGPLGAADLASGLALISLHLVVGATVVVGARWARLRGVA